MQLISTLNYRVLINDDYQVKSIQKLHKALRSKLQGAY